MSCLLCFGVERDEQLLNIASTESQRYNVAAVLRTHFGFCFPEEPIEGFVCQKCWVKVSVFHDFYIHIEYVHRSNESIFVESIVGDIKPDIDSDSDRWEFDFAPEPEPIDQKTQNPVKRKRGRPRKNARLPSDDSDSNDPDYFDGGNGAETIENNGRIKVESLLETNVNRERKPTKGKRRKDETLAKREDKFMCDKCALEFTTANGLYRHSKQVHDVLEFKCSYLKCIESFASQDECDEHAKAMHKQTECPHCNKLILVKCIDQHIKEQHDAGNQIICDHCGRVSANRAKHKSHFRKVHQIHDRLQCDICKRWLKHRDALKGHMLRHVQGPQKCSICGHISPNRKALGKHKHVHDPGRKERFRCTTCGKTCRDKLSLQEHSHIHTGFAGSYHCEDCGRIFRFSSSFCLHKKKMHPK